MKLVKNTLRNVSVSARDVAKFNAQWPCSGIPVRACWFAFERNGDLVDMSAHLYSDSFDGDGSALNALSQDAQKLIQIPSL